MNDVIQAANLVHLGGGHYIDRFKLADALIRAGFLTPAGRVPGDTLLDFGLRPS